MTPDGDTEYRAGDAVWVNLRGAWSGSAVRTMSLPADPDWRAATVSEALSGGRYRVQTAASTYAVPAARLRPRAPDSGGG